MGDDFVGTKIVKEEVIRVRVDKELKDRLKIMCDDKKITMSKFIVNAIENEVEKYDFNLKNEKLIKKRIEETEKKLQRLKEKLSGKIDGKYIGKEYGKIKWVYSSIFPST